MSQNATAWHRLRRGVAGRVSQRWVQRASRYLERGEPNQALACCRRALDLFPDCQSAYMLMARVLMPGDDYLAVLRFLHEQVRPRTYLEIGVRHGDSLALARPEARAIGVDPAPAVRARIGSRARLYPLTSDKFFEKYDLLTELDASVLDLAFIDGLHQFGQVLKDFANIERVSDSETIVLVHDCLPATRFAADPNRVTRCWCGDVWKIIPCLRECRPDLNVRVILAPPSGLGMITHLDSGSTLLRDRYEQLVVEYQGRDLGYEYLDAAGIGAARHVLPNDQDRIRREVAGANRRRVTDEARRSCANCPSAEGQPVSMACQP